MIHINRIYNLSGDEPSYKILVDGIWPRGVKKDDPRIDQWMKEVAPGKDLRQWFSHDPDKWEEFRSAYKKELLEKAGLLREIRNKAQEQDVTLVFSARDTRHNHAVVLKEVLENH